MRKAKQGKTRTAVYGCFLAALLATVLGCGQKRDYPYEFMEEKDGVSVYLDGARGKLIYIDANNNVIDYVSLRPSAKAARTIAENKEQALKTVDRGTDTLRGTAYSISLSTRFYNNRLLYVLELGPKDDMAWSVAGTVEINLMDADGFSVGTIVPLNPWADTIETTDGGTVECLITQGSVPFSLSDYLEFATWESSWEELSPPSPAGEWEGIP
ncbi:MAG: hypothetical protein LBG84_01735 [Treponema sp.]|jgi:hypothetical protein|nr:hypothetical protein [Treponema sp.]